MGKKTGGFSGATYKKVKKDIASGKIPTGGGTGVQYKDIPGLPQLNGITIQDNKTPEDYNIRQPLRLTYDGTSIKKDGIAQTYTGISTLYANTKYMLFIDYSNLVLTPAKYTNTTFDFIGVYISSGQTHILKISLNSSNTVTETDYIAQQKDLMKHNISDYDPTNPDTEKYYASLKALYNINETRKNYENGTNLPKIENHELKGNTTLAEIGAVSTARKIVNKALTNDITAQDIVDAIKELSATLKNKSIDLDNNTLTNMVLTCFKSGIIQTTVRSATAATDTALATEKAVRTAIAEAVAGLFNIQGNKATEAEILAITTADDYDAWLCEENGKLYYWLTTQWLSVPFISITDYVKKTTKIGTHTLDNDITAQNIYDDIKDSIENYKEVNTFVGITGNTKTLYYLTADITGYDKGIYRYNGTDFEAIGGGVVIINASTRPTTGISTKAWYKIGATATVFKIELYDGTNWHTIYDTEKEVADKFQYSTMPTASATNVGRIYQYIGSDETTYKKGYFYECKLDTSTSTYSWVSAEVQAPTTVYDKSTEMSTKNSTLMNLNTNSFKCMAGLTFINEKMTYKANITDLQSTARVAFKLPKLPTGYTYPSKLRLNVYKPSGYYTCMENKTAFYDSTGAHYVNPNVGVGTKFSCESIVKIEGAKDSSGNAILIAEQKTNPSGALVVDTNGAPVCTKQTIEITQGSTENPKVYTLLYTTGSGYTFVGSYVDASGVTHTGNYYKLHEITPTINTTYLYYCKLYATMMDKVGRNFLVDSSGRLCTISLSESQESQTIKAKESGKLTSDFIGCSGSYTITPITNKESMTNIDGEVVYNSTDDDYDVKVNGTNAMSGIDLATVM